MILHFQNARLIDPEAQAVEETTLTIRDGRIDAVGAEAPEGAELIDCNGKYLAPGLVDWGVKIGEPGERHKESFRSAGLAAAAGGVTTVIARPDTMPPIDTPESLEFATRRAADAPVNIRHMASLTRAREGREMVEMSFLQDAGAVAFTDGVRVVADTRLMSRCMTYARGLNALIVGHPQEPLLSKGAAATSGKFASLYGLPAVSPMAEVMGLDRDLSLVAMTGSRYHADQITVAASLPALKRAREAGLDVTAGTSIHHLTLNEFDVGDYRTFFRFTPPLRSEDDRLAIIEAVAEGVIDVIASFHTPQDEESKRLPFAEAAPGAVGLQTLLPAAMRLYHSGGLSLSQLWRAMSLNPAKRLGLEAGRVGIGAPADLVLFNPNAPFIMDRFTLLSKSKNTPFDGARMQGRVLGTWVAGRRVFGDPA
ncbi:dihydroorotase [Paracoccus aestuariivivens]|uniref:Amidohydrolase family protein n=1 Tax=Paracoccus aestuariivivens TaxID=1820333 RepID=A0A6L6J3L6_9RHOB|nr:dihydroorotase [Paracoccus aestuariivivens]MTH76723.1 amidohydrolase family protein [Paracoccus aestuariivivens]